MGGQDGARGYLIQALSCVLDGLDQDHDWLSVTIEPNDESEKVDIAWQYDNHRKVIQVKSSKNTIKLSSIKRWAKNLQESTVADSYELRVFGPCSAGVTGTTSIGKVRIPTPEVINLDRLMEQTAHRLDRYLVGLNPFQLTSPYLRELIVAALSHKLGVLSTKGTPFPREKLNTLLADWLHEASRDVRATKSNSETLDVDAYLRRFRDYYVEKLPPFVATTLELDHARHPSTDLLGFMSQGEHAQIVGESGYGKSLLVYNMALCAANAGQIPVIARGIEYAGNFGEILDRAIAAFCSCEARELLNAGREAGRSMTIVVDGINECPAALHEQLLLELQAFYLRYNVPIILTSQCIVTLPSELSGRVIKTCELDSSQRHEILEAYVPTELPDHADLLCQPFRSAFELSIASICIHEIRDCPSRAALFDTYIRTKLRGATDILVLRRILSTIAGAMRLQLRSSLPLTEVERLSESVLDQQHLPVTSLRPILLSGLIDIQLGVCVFRHELLQRYFEAIDLVRSTNRLEVLLDELAKPVHHSLIEFVLGMESDLERFAKILRAAAHIRSCSHVTVDCLANRFGQSVNLLVRADIELLFRNAILDLPGIAVSIAKSNEDAWVQHLVQLSGQREWNSYELALWNLVAKRLQLGEFLDESLTLVAETERVIGSLLAQAIGETTANKSSIKSQVFFDVFVVGAQRHALPASILVDGAMNRWMTVDSEMVADCLCSRFGGGSGVSDAELYLLLRIAGGRFRQIESSLAAILKRGWHSGIYHLQLEVLQYVQQWANADVGEVCLTAESRQAVESILTSFETNNLLLNTQLVETLTCFNLLKLAIDVDDVRSQISDILSTPDDPPRQQEAANAISNMFEDVFQGLYYEAIESLSLEDRNRLYRMAALAVPSYSISAAFILGHLLQNASQENAPAFIRFATTIDSEPYCDQTTTQCFIFAHQGLAALCDEPWSLAEIGNDDCKAWQTYGELFFWLAKPGLSTAELEQKCMPLWSILSHQLRHAAVDPLMRFAKTTVIRRQDAKDDLVHRLFVDFRHQVRRILETGVGDRENLTSIDKRRRDDLLLREHTVFILDTLGQLGIASTIPLLKPFADDEYYGEIAVEGIRAINSGVQFLSLRVLMQCP